MWNARLALLRTCLFAILGAADLAALADICLFLIEAKIEEKAAMPETAMQATVECVVLALLSASARDGKFTAKVMYGDFQR